MENVGRKSLPHERPLWLAGNQTYFITICGKPRGTRALVIERVARGLITSFAWRHSKGFWFGHLLVIMPDHVHFLITEMDEISVTAQVRAWKRYCARTLAIHWQRDFFEHRIRSNRSLSEKYNYILNNPKCAGFVQHVEDWPYIWRPN